MDDLWHIKNPPAVLAYCLRDHIVADGPESITITWAIHPDQDMIEFLYVPPQPCSADDPILVSKIVLRCDRRHDGNWLIPDRG